jgi:hypothetical protein
LQLTRDQQQAIREKHGIVVFSACDKCSQLLGPVRYTRKNEPGEWCSRVCRDGEEILSIVRRKGGRPPKYRTEAERKAANAKYQRNFRLKVTETPQPVAA